MANWRNEDERTGAGAGERSGQRGRGTRRDDFQYEDAEDFSTQDALSGDDRGRSPRSGRAAAQRSGYAQRGYDEGWDQRERESLGGGGLRGMPIAGGVGLGDGGYAGNYQLREEGRGRGGGDEYDTRFGRYPEPRWGDLHRRDEGSARQAGRGHRGRGSSSYTRSDERIREDLYERLADDDDIDASDIHVEVAEGVVTLTGTVEARWAKHMAEDLADGCYGVKDVENRLRVERDGPRAGGTSGPEAGAGGGSGPGRA